MTSSEREAVEKITVTVAEHHLPAVPERVIVAAPVMHARVETQPFVVDRIAIVDFGVEIECRAEAVVGLVYFHIGHARRAFRAHHPARQCFMTLRIVDRALLRGRRDPEQSMASPGFEQLIRRATEPQRLIHRQRVERRLALIPAAMERDPPQHVGRKNAAARKTPAASTNQAHGKFPVAPRQAAAPFYHAMVARGLPATAGVRRPMRSGRVLLGRATSDIPETPPLSAIFSGLAATFLRTRWPGNTILDGRSVRRDGQAAGR